MAEIPVERKSKMSPLAWLIGLLVLAALLFLLTRGCGDGVDDGRVDMTPDTATSPAATIDAAPGTGGAMDTAASGLTGASGGVDDTAGMGASGSGAAGGAITDVGTVVSAADRKAMAGRGIDLSSVEVVRVISDRGFTVGPGSGQELFVMLDDKLNEGAAEQRVQIKPGQRLRLGGTLMEPPSAETEQERFRGLSKQESSELRAQDVYLHANTIDQAQ